MYFVRTNAIGQLDNQLVGPFATIGEAKAWADERPSYCPPTYRGGLPVHDVCPVDMANRWPVE